MTVTLRKIDENNFLDAFHLRLAEGQERFVSHPIRSLAQAYVYYRQCTPFGIYDGDAMVGYVMVIYDYDVPEYDVWHMMIDASRQGRGYGRAALQAVLDYIRTQPFGDSRRVALTCNHENAAALKLYREAGFQPTGVSDEDEAEFHFFNRQSTSATHISVARAAPDAPTQHNPRTLHPCALSPSPAPFQMRPHTAIPRTSAERSPSPARLQASLGAQLPAHAPALRTPPARKPLSSPPDPPQSAAAGCTSPAAPTGTARRT